jgi:protein-disulfide isomerase
MLIAFVGGLAIGFLAGQGGGEHGEEVAAVELDAEAQGAAKEAAGGVERFKVPVTDAQPQKGAEQPLVTIVEFSEFQCPFCSRVLPTVKKIMDEYDGKVRIAWRNNPLPMHNNAPAAAQAAMEAHEQGGDEKFWQMHDILFDNQKALSRSDLEQYAKRVGLDMGKFKAALDNNEHMSQVKKDQQLAQKLGARGTPAFFINGRKLMGAQPYDKFKEIVDDEIARAEKMVGAGVPKGQLYAAFQESAKTSPGGDKPSQERAKKKRRRPDPDAVYKVPTGDSPAKGPENALVTIVEFSEFQCPFCSRVLPTMKKIQEEYGNDVRIVFRHNPLPFHDNAMPAAIAAHEVYEQGGDRKFWQYHDILFENQRALTRDNLEKWAKQIGGINMGKLKKALDTKAHKSKIEKDQQLARSLGASGTPAFFINGRNLRGAQPFPAFKSVIDEELAKAKKMVKSGTSKSQLYAKIIEDGATSQKFIEPEGGGGGGGADEAAKEYDLEVPKDAPRKGAKNAKVVIQEFSDFQCPFCSRVLPTLDKVVDEYGDKVAIVWRNYPLPFHQQAMPAAQAALEVHEQGGDKKFWQYHDILFQNQRSLTRDNLEKWAKQIGGINMAQFKKALDTNEHKSDVEADMSAVREAGARIGTPSFFIDGKLIQGAQPYSKFKEAIDAALEGS